MKRFLKVTVLITMILQNADICSLDSIITLFLQKYPYIKKPKNNSDTTFNADRYSKKLKQPDYVYRKITHTHKDQSLPGIMCLYAGRATISNSQGQIVFPKKQQTQDMYILISQGIKPAYMIAPSTVHNWMLDRKHSAEMYLMKLKQDPTSTLYYYETSKIDLPDNNNIPLNTIVFIANPETMYVPLGATIVDHSPNITLPTIYVKRGFCFIYNSLYTLAINQYFEPTQTEFKQDSATIAQIQQLH